MKNLAIAASILLVGSISGRAFADADVTPPVAGDQTPKPVGKGKDVPKGKSKASQANAEAPVEEAAGKGTSPATRRDLAMGLEPGAPDLATLPGGITPAFGSQPTRADDWRFDFHGLVLLPLRIGLGERDKALSGQKKLTLHGPPRVPGDLESFDYTSVVPNPWVQLNFSYGTSTVAATVIVAARSVADGNAYFNPPDQLGINDAYLTFRRAKADNWEASVDVGAFSNRYGAMGQYDLGRYGTPLIARLGGMGATGTLRYDLGEVRLSGEAGFVGQLNKAPVGVEPAGWNGFADPNVGTSFAVHGHLGAEWTHTVNLGLHAIHAFEQDDRAATTTQPDGRITVLGADLRLTPSKWGHFYMGFARTDASTARGVSNVIRVLNAPGGPGLMTEYFGPDSGGTGKLTTFGANYDLSLANLLNEGFTGRSPDILISAFTVVTKVSSPSAAYDGIIKVKYGAEASYSMLNWLGVGARYDRVVGNVDDDSKTSGILTGRLILRSDYQARDQIVLQYSKWFNGSSVVVRDGYPPAYDATIVPDGQMVSLTATMWW